MEAELRGPIGIFDSGVGGLSVLKEIRKLLPCENLIYVADSAYVPYGNKSPQFILERSEKISEFLISKGAKAIVIACNTATAVSVKPLRIKWPRIPILGMEPAVKPALEKTKTGIVGVLATVGTLKSAQFAALLDKFEAKTRVVLQAAPGLVEYVERGDLDSRELRQLIASYVSPLVLKGVDVIVLGCTHYPFLREIIQQEAGVQVALVDTGAAVAKQLKRRLLEYSLLENVCKGGSAVFYTTGATENTLKALSTLLDDLASFDLKAVII
ncbi:MAG: glutamate racemase [Bdellovibrionota bacterium]